MWFCLVLVTSVDTPCVRVVYGDDGRVECMYLLLFALFGPVRLRLEFASWQLAPLVVVEPPSSGVRPG